MAMSGLDAYILSCGYAEELATGISSIQATPTGFNLICTSGTVLSFVVPNMHTHSNLNTILEKFSLDGSNNLLFEGKMVINDPIVNDNKEFTILSSKWVQDSVDPDKYTWTETHNLKTKSIDCTVYNNLDEEETVGVKTPDIDTVVLTSLVPFDGRIVINYSTVLSSVSGGSSVSDGTVKMTISDATGQYLADLIDNSTVQNVSGKLVVKSLDGLVIGTTELNLLQGMTENVKAKFDSLSTAMRFTGTVATKASLLAVGTMASGDVKIVLADETNSGKKITYIYDSSNWVSLGEFNVVIRNFSVTPLDLTSEVTGVLPTTNLPVDTDGTLSSNSDTKIASEKAVKTYIDSKAISISGVAGDIISIDTDGKTPIDSGKKVSTDGTMVNNSDNNISTEKAIKTYADTKIPKVTSPTTNDIAIMNSDGTISDGGILKTDIVTKTGTQTIQNKTYADSIDSTKQFSYDISGVSTGTKRNLKVQDKDGTIALTSDIKTMTGATSSTAGVSGDVPQPLAGYQDASLKGDGWDKTGRGTKIALVNQTVNVTLTNTTSVDICEFLEIPQSTSGTTINLPTPTVTTSSRRLIVTNTGSVSFTMNSITVNANSSYTFFWNPTLSAWTTQPQNNATSTALAYASLYYQGGVTASNFTISSATTWTQITGMTTSGYSNATIASNAITITQAGVYNIRTQLDIDTTGAGSNVIAVYKNGVATWYGGYDYETGNSVDPTIDITVPLAVGDVLKLYVYANTSGASISSGYFQIEQLPSATVIPASYTNVQEWASYTPVITATTTNPTYSSTYTMKGLYKQVGKTLNIEFVYYGGANGGGAGNGTYLFSIPAGYTINVALTGTTTTGADGLPVGNGFAFQNSANTGILSVVVYDSTHLALLDHSANQLVSSSRYALNIGAERIAFTCDIPIS